MKTVKEEDIFPYSLKFYKQQQSFTIAKSIAVRFQSKTLQKAELADLNFALILARD